MKRADNEILKAKGWGASVPLHLRHCCRAAAGPRALQGPPPRPPGSPSPPRRAGSRRARPHPSTGLALQPRPGQDTRSTTALQGWLGAPCGGARLPACYVMTQVRSVRGVRGVYGGSRDWRLRRAVFPQDAPACSLHPRPSRVPGGPCRPLRPGERRGPKGGVSSPALRARLGGHLRPAG